MKYTVWSKSKHGSWVIERSYTLESYAKQHKDAINKRTERKAKIITQDTRRMK